MGSPMDGSQELTQNLANLLRLLAMWPKNLTDGLISMNSRRDELAT